MGIQHLEDGPQHYLSSQKRSGNHPGNRHRPSDDLLGGDLAPDEYDVGFGDGLPQALSF